MTTAAALEELVRLAAPRLVRSPADVGPAGSLADALTARGFFCAGRREEVLVFDDRDAGDVRSLIGVVPTALAPSVTAFSVPPLSNEETSGLVRRVLSLPSPQGTTAIGGPVEHLGELPTVSIWRATAAKQPRCFCGPPGPCPQHVGLPDALLGARHR